MTASLRKQVGQLMIVGVEGVELSAIERSWLKLIEPGGVILFRRNIESAAATFALLGEIEASSSKLMFRCVDVEGGLVDRLREAIAPMPSLAAVAASGSKSLYRRHGRLIGRTASALGFNTVFAPVLDLALPESHQVMRTRTFFAEPRELIRYAAAFLEGLAGANVLGCGKHFPGLGGGTLDSHHATPAIARDWQTLWSEDMLPYRELKSQLPMVMVSHAVYPLTGETVPASVSSYWIDEILTKKIGYRGLIVSDDMEMGSIASETSIEQAVVRAVFAGTHLVEVCKEPALVLRAYEALLAEAERSTAFRGTIECAYRKVIRSKRLLTSVREKKPPSLSQVEKLRRDVLQFSMSLPNPSAEAAP